MSLEVLNKRCPECLFSKNRLTTAKTAKNIVEKCLRADSHFICHRSTMNGGNAVCRGFFDKHSTNLIRIAGRLGLIRYIDIPSVNPDSDLVMQDADQS